MSEQKRMLLAVVLSGVILFGWQALYGPKENIDKKSENTKKSKTNVDDEENSGFVPPRDENKKVPVKKKLESQNWDLKVNNDNNLVLTNSLSLLTLNSKNNQYPINDVFGTDKILSIFVLVGDVFKEVFFEVDSAQSNDYEINANNEQYEIHFYIKLNDNGIAKWTLTSPKAYRYRFVINSKKYDQEIEQNAKMGSVRPGTSREFLYFSEKAHRYAVDSDERIDGTQVKWFGIDFNYHFFGVIFPENRTFTFSIKENHFNANLARETYNISGKLLYVKKDYDKLVTLGDNLSASVDFGMFEILAVPLLRGLQKIYQLIPNYGVAIIFLTLLIRLVLHPLNYKSFKSMKKMQKIQPEMQKIREKYKDDPKLMQQKSMELFKKAGANPMGGCLPMLLQFPVFLAFYAVLSNAVELVNAPFALWIVDLSAKDPFYILPILMAAAMFLQQKLMPSSAQMDETQQKIMMFMPLIFAIFMKDVPSGLTLYILVSTIVGMLQQLIIYRQSD